jgi:hypothetical protein
MISPRRTVLFAALLVAFFTATGCDSGGADPRESDLDPGTSTLTLSDEDEAPAQFTADAFYVRTVVQEEGRPDVALSGFVFAYVSETDTLTVSLTAGIDRDAPAVGTAPITGFGAGGFMSEPSLSFPTDAYFGSYLRLRGQAPVFGFATDGELTVDRVEDDLFEGRFSFDAYTFSFSDAALFAEEPSATGSVAGAFVARIVTIDDLEERIGEIDPFPASL